MSAVDISKIKVGDEVTARFIVGRVEPGIIFPRPDSGARGYTYFEQSDIISHTPKPRPIEVGSKVRVNSKNFAEVIAIEPDGKVCCIRYDGGVLSLIHTDALECVS